ncbi:hypothetical protein [Sporosarcina ureilytica]|uniref:Uncharacterized protein n=1 Tax=Sporosarcina ureilytica TaxID=298596 RepID=A0A1D8JI95_9BACL|nr:hypothetical protein [Sporosarcina ureilytica]AOV08435.1 hypothetical protein BI350_13425 [Sporosarcina ureilytica]
MGYILPVSSFRSQQYANRIMASEETAEIPRVHRIDMNTDFSQVLERTIISQQVIKEQMQQKRSLAPLNSQSTIYSNQANLLPANAPMIGKGIAINTYV